MSAATGVDSLHLAATSRRRGRPEGPVVAPPAPGGLAPATPSSSAMPAPAVGPLDLHSKASLARHKRLLALPCRVAADRTVTLRELLTTLTKHARELKDSDGQPVFVASKIEECINGGGFRYRVGKGAWPNDVDPMLTFVPVGGTAEAWENHIRAMVTAHIPKAAPWLRFFDDLCFVRIPAGPSGIDVELRISRGKIAFNYQCNGLRVSLLDPSVLSALPGVDEKQALWDLAHGVLRQTAPLRRRAVFGAVKEQMRGFVPAGRYATGLLHALEAMIRNDNPEASLAYGVATETNRQLDSGSGHRVHVVDSMQVKVKPLTPANVAFLLNLIHLAETAEDNTPIKAPLLARAREQLHLTPKEIDAKDAPAQLVVSLSATSEGCRDLELLTVLKAGMRAGVFDPMRPPERVACERVHVAPVDAAAPTDDNTQLPRRLFVPGLKRYVVVVPRPLPVSDEVSPMHLLERDAAGCLFDDRDVTALWDPATLPPRVRQTQADTLLQLADRARAEQVAIRGRLLFACARLDPSRNLDAHLVRLRADAPDTYHAAIDTLREEGATQRWEQALRVLDRIHAASDVRQQAWETCIETVTAYPRRLEESMPAIVARLVGTPPQCAGERLGMGWLAATVWQSLPPDAEVRTALLESTWLLMAGLAGDKTTAADAAVTALSDAIAAHPWHAKGVAVARRSIVNIAKAQPELALQLLTRHTKQIGAAVPVPLLGRLGSAVARPEVRPAVLGLLNLAKVDVRAAEAWLAAPQAALLNTLLADPTLHETLLAVAMRSKSWHGPSLNAILRASFGAGTAGPERLLEVLRRRAYLPTQLREAWFGALNALGVDISALTPLAKDARALRGLERFATWSAAQEPAPPPEAAKAPATADLPSVADPIAGVRRGDWTPALEDATFVQLDALIKQGTLASLAAASDGLTALPAFADPTRYSEGVVALLMQARPGDGNAGEAWVRQALADLSPGTTRTFAMALALRNSADTPMVRWLKYAEAQGAWGAWSPLGRFAAAVAHGLMDTVENTWPIGKPMPAEITRTGRQLIDLVVPKVGPDSRLNPALVLRLEGLLSRFPALADVVAAHLDEVIQRQGIEKSRGLGMLMRAFVGAADDDATYEARRDACLQKIVVTPGALSRLGTAAVSWLTGRPALTSWVVNAHPPAAVDLVGALFPAHTAGEDADTELHNLVYVQAREVNPGGVARIVLAARDGVPRAREIAVQALLSRLATELGERPSKQRESSGRLFAAGVHALIDHWYAGDPAGGHAAHAELLKMVDEWFDDKRAFKEWAKAAAQAPGYAADPELVSACEGILADKGASGVDMVRLRDRESLMIGWKLLEEGTLEAFKGGLQLIATSGGAVNALDLEQKTALTWRLLDQLLDPDWRRACKVVLSQYGKKARRGAGLALLHEVLRREVPPT